MADPDPDDLSYLYEESLWDRANADARRRTGGVVRPMTPDEASRSLWRLILDAPAGHAEASPEQVAPLNTPGSGKAGRSIG